jgi:chemotaxis protein MotB
MSDLHMSADSPPADAHGDAHAATDHAASHSSTAGHGGGHKKHGDHGGHGGGHGGSWIITYCDMITLLIAFFICILTFASKESGKGNHQRLHDSLVNAPGGTGIAGSKGKPADQDAVAWRQVLLSTNAGPGASSIPPLYSDPAWTATHKVLAMLEQPAERTLSESYELVIPIAMLFAKQNTLTPTAKHLLQTIARNLGPLPYELFIHVDNAANLSRATTISQFIVWQGMPQGRLGIGINDSSNVPNDSVRLLFVKRPRQSGR